MRARKTSLSAVFETVLSENIFGPFLMKGPPPFRTVMESDSAVFCYSVVNLLRIVIHCSKYSKSVQHVVIHYIFSSQSLRIVNSLQIVNSLHLLFLVGRVPRVQNLFGDPILTHTLNPRIPYCGCLPARQLPLYPKLLPN